MKNVKAPTSDSYQDYLISRLKEPSYAATYLIAHFDEEDQPDPKLLELALTNVLEALGQNTLTPEQFESCRQEISNLLTQSGSQAIYGLTKWLKTLGLKLAVIINTETTD